MNIPPPAPSYSTDDVKGASSRLLYMRSRLLIIRSKGRRCGRSRQAFGVLSGKDAGSSGQAISRPRGGRSGRKEQTALIGVTVKVVQAMISAIKGVIQAQANQSGLVAVEWYEAYLG